MTFEALDRFDHVVCPSRRSRTRWVGFQVCLALSESSTTVGVVSILEMFAGTLGVRWLSFRQFLGFAPLWNDKLTSYIDVLLDRDLLHIWPVNPYALRFFIDPQPFPCMDPSSQIRPTLNSNINLFTSV